MANILDILTRAQALRQETALNSITPDRAGGIMYDTLILINQMQLEGGSLLISKVYSSVAAMEADTTPTSDLTGRALRPGQLAVIVPSSSTSSDMGSVYRYNEPGSWTLCGKIGGLPMDTVPTEGSSNGITSGAVYSALSALKNEGYKYMGVATPGSGGTSPGTPNQPVFYVAGPGSYPNFGNLTVAAGYLGFFKYSSGSWSVESVAVGKDYDTQLSTLEGQITQLEAKVDDLKNDVDLKIDGVGTAEKDIIWTDGYANYAKKITANAQSQFSQPVLLKRGETILYKSSKDYSSAIVSVPNDNPVSIGDTLSGDTLLVYGAQKIGTTEQYTATSDIYIVISVSKADREISFLAHNENSVVSQIEKVRDELPLNLENRGVCDKFDEYTNGYTVVTNNYITLLQGHKYRFAIEFKHPGTLGDSANLKLVSADSIASVKLLISLGGQTISENQKISEDLLWTDASVENYRLALYDPLAAGIKALKDAIVTAKDVSTDTLLDWMAEYGKYPLTKVGFLSVHNNDVKIDFTSSTIVIPAYTRVIYKVSGNSYSATSNVATTLQRDANYEQIICFNETSKEFVARGISGVQDDDYILFVIQNSAAYGKDRTTLSPSLYTIDGKAPFVMQSEGLYKTAQVLSDSEKTQVLTNLGIAEGFVSYPSKYGSVPKVSSGTDAFAITGVDLVKGHTYEAKIVAENTITAPSDFNLKICNNTSGSTIYRIMTLGGLTFSEKTARFVWENETVGDYRVGFYGNGTVNTKIEVFLKDVSIDAVKDAIKVTPVVDWNRHKEAALISVASKSGNENIKVANKLTLLHFSDVHGNTANLANIVTYGDHYSDLLDDIIHTGDSVHTQMSDTNPFVSVEGAENILNVIGNHEAWLNTSDPDYYATEKQTYDKIFAPSIANWGVVQPAGAADNGYCYYYKDFTTAGFRLIVLDSVHWHYRNGTTDSNPAQKAWFESVLADAITQNLRVVCATHYTPQNGIVPVENTGFNVLGTTAGANIADGWFAADEIFGCVDTFIGNGGKFMGWIMGHTHNDYFGTVRNHTGQPIVVIGTSKGSGSGQNKFIANTVSQDNFNVITFENLNAKDYIKIVKIGQDTDIYTRSKNTICYNFTDGVLISTT